MSRHTPPVVLPTANTLRKYGLSEKDYIRLWECCQGRCPICERPFNIGRKAVIDHDHTTNQVRGLLCSPCNQRIGWLHDNYEWMERAFWHLSAPLALTVLDGPRYTLGSPQNPKRKRG